MTSHAFTPPPSQLGRGDVIISYGISFGLIVNTGVRLAVASERISHGFQFEFRQLPKFSQYPIRSSVFRIYPVSPKRSRAFQFRHLRSSDFDDGKLVQSNSFSRSISSGVLQSESIRSGYWNGYVRCDPGVGQTPNDEMTDRLGLYTVDESN